MGGAVARDCFMTKKHKDAIARVETLANEVFLDPVISQAGPHTFYRATKALQAKTEQDWQRLFELAVAGDPDADRVICLQAANALADGQPLPPLLALYVAEVLFKRFHETEGKAHRLLKRNLFISKAVSILRDAGIHPTRNRTLHGRENNQSGCSIVTALLARFDKTPLTESAVEKVWEEFVRKSAS
jgi:hypothetical protein